MSGASGERVDYMRRADGPGDARGVEIYSRDLGGVSMEQLSTQLRQTRRLVSEIDARDLRRGFTLTLLVLLGAAWLVSLLPLVLIAHRVSRPIQQLTAALTDFAGGDWSRRLETGGQPGAPPRDEVGRAVDAFNHMADQLEESRERLVHLTRMASWQSLARKTAHELKNSLTPIRLIVEEMQARQPAPEVTPKPARSWTRPSRSSSAKSSHSSGACGHSLNSRASRRCIPRLSTSTRSSPSGWRCCAR